MAILQGFPLADMSVDIFGEASQEQEAERDGAAGRRAGDREIRFVMALLEATRDLERTCLR